MASNSVIDLSHHDSVESFHEAYESGVRLVILKATQGTSYLDPTFKTRCKNLAAYLPQMLVGAYHFGTGAPAAAQAKWFIDTVDSVEQIIGRAIKVRALDFETNPTGSTMSLSQAEEFVRCYQKVTAKLPLVYGGSLLKENTISPQSPLLKCELWLADYHSTPRLPKGWQSWRIWQYSAPEDQSGPPVPGIGACDKDKFNGMPGDLMRWYAAL